MDLRRLGSAVALSCVLGSGSPAHALSLLDAVGGVPLSSGGLLFSDFQVVIAGDDLSIDLCDYAVSPILDGFSLTGPLVATPGESGTLTLRYRVEPSDPGAALGGARLSFDGQALGDDAASLVVNGFESLASASLGSLLVYAIDGVGSLDDVSLAFAPEEPGLLVSLLVQLDASEPGAILALTGPVDQRFTLVPEASALVLCSLGVLGLVLMGRRRRGTARLEI